jgi:hypothetical protein
VVNFRPRPIYTRKETGYPLNRGWFGPRTVSAHFETEENILLLAGFEPVFSLSEFQIFLSPFFKLDTILQPNVALSKIKFI